MNGGHTMVEEEYFSDDEQKGESRNDQIEGTKNSTATVNRAQIQMQFAMQQEFAGAQSSAAENSDLISSAIDLVFNASSSDKVLVAIEPEPERISHPFIPDEIKQGGNSREELELLTKEELVEKYLELEDVLNTNWKEQREDEATLERLGAIPSESGECNRYSTTSFYSLQDQGPDREAKILALNTALKTA